MLVRSTGLALMVTLWLAAIFVMVTKPNLF
jgi:hypothetical protein